MVNFTVTDTEKDRWHIIYTRSRWEKKVDLLLKSQNITSFCPLIKTTRRWVDRTKVVELPLLSSYLFVRADPKTHLKVLNTSGVIKFVNYCGKPATLCNDEIERIKKIVDTYQNIDTINLPQIRIGDKVKIVDGVLYDMKGEVLRIRGKSVVLFMDQLNCALVVKAEQLMKSCA